MTQSATPRTDQMPAATRRKLSELFTPDQIAAQCAAFGPVLKDHVAALSLKPSDEVLAGIEAIHKDHPNPAP